MADSKLYDTVTRSDPYRTFRFQVTIGGVTVAGMRKMSALKRSTEVIPWRVGGDPNHERKLPGGSKFDPITLEHGLTQDKTFENWANMVNGPDSSKPLTKGFRQEVCINVMALNGKIAFSYKIKNAWVSEYQALPELDASAMGQVGIQTITIEHDGWERVTPSGKDDKGDDAGEVVDPLKVGG